MNPEVKVPLKVIRVWGKIARLTTAKRGSECTCGLPIEKGAEYYRVYHTGAIFGAPNYGVPFGEGERVHIRCINNYLNGTL